MATAVAVATATDPKHDPVPPYGAKPPLPPWSKTVRARIVGWIIAYDNAVAGKQVDTPQKYAHMSDDDLLGIYIDLATISYPNRKSKGGITDNPILGPVVGGVTAITDILGFLTSADVWIRIGEAIVGVVLLAVGIRYAMGSSLGEAQSQTANNIHDLRKAVLKI